MIDLAAKPFYLKPEDIEWVNKTLAGMTTEEKAGQLFCVLFKECKPEEFEYVFNILKPGGCMYRVVPTERAIAATQNIYSRSKVPPLIAANLEKGGNGIVTEGTLVGAPMEIAATDDTGMATKMAHACAAEASAVGANWAFAPIIDIDTNYRNPITNTRTFGSDPERVRRMGCAYVEEVQKMGLAASIKHFPGDGAAENGFESHTSQGQWRLYPTAGSLEKYQLVGFQAAVDAGVGAIMPCYSRDAADVRSVPQSYRGHEIDVKQLGSAYNSEIITTLLRDIMGFKGFVNSDSGITLTQTYGVESLTSIQRFALLIKAGTDAIGAELAPEYIVSAVEFGLLDKADLDRANINRATALFKQGRFENPYLDYEQADVVRATNMETAHDQAYSLHLKATVLMKNHENTLPLSKNAGTKVYIASYTGTGENEATLKALAELFVQQGFTVCEDMDDADVVYFYVQPKATNKAGASETEGVLSLVDGFEVAQRQLGGGADAAVTAMFGAGGQGKTGEMVDVTTVEGIKKLQKAANKMHEKGGKVIATIVCTSPWILDNLEPYCDALLAQYTTSAASLSNAYSAQVDVIVGNYNPTGKLSVTLPSCEAVIALTEVRDADGNLLYEECASPNDVPGYDKDQYIAPEVLAQSPSGSYIYKDADGNSYVSGFGLSY